MTDVGRMNGDGAPPVLIALDWGTSSLRGFLMDGAGRVLAERSSGRGIQALPRSGAAGYQEALADLCGDWMTGHPALPMVACGMVGSAQGWVEAPYVACPADTATLARHAASVDCGGRRVLIAPGLLYDPPGGIPDVMRGEEVQIAGALAEDSRWASGACAVMPGTHSKWVRVVDGRIAGFSTHMTGELFAMLTAHSILGRLMPDGAEAAPEVEADAFERGIAMARAGGPGDLSHQLFAVRTLGLTGRMAPEGLRHCLSGLLIGHELVAGLRALAGAPSSASPLLLIGDAALCRRYRRGMEILGVAPTACLGNTAPRGLFQFAAAAGVVAPRQP